MMTMETAPARCANCGMSRAELRALAEWGGGVEMFGYAPVCCEHPLTEDWYAA